MPPPHLIQYRVKAEEVAHNDELLAAVFAELEEKRPPGLRYAAYKLPDGVSYVHIVEMTEEGHGAPKGVASLKAFHQGIRERCEQPPTRTLANPVGRYES